MKCRNCKKVIPENEVFCKDCKETLKDASSTEELKELENLIQERNEVDSLGSTKDLTNITELVKEEVKEEPVIDDDFKDVKDSKIATIITVFVVGIIIGALVFGVIWFLNRPKRQEEAPKKVVDYEKIITEYGDIVKEEATKYIKANNEIPTWQVLSDLIKYDAYEISCQVHNVYIDGSIYLQHCKVNNKSIKYTYGTLMEDAKTGKELNVYKNDSNYTDTETEELVGTIVCNTTNCEFYKAFDKYVIVKEKNAYYLYNYDNNAVEFGPFNDFKILNYNNELYGIYYAQDGQKNIYNVTLGKTLKGIKGSIDFEKDYVDTNIQYKYGYIITSENGFNFINLKTGNVSFVIKDNIKTFIEDIKSGILYIIVDGSEKTKFKIYNSNGKLMFNGGEFTDFKVLDNSLITFTENSFKVYDSKLNVKVTSNSYTKILRIYDSFIVTLDKKNLKLIDYNDKVIATFDREWNDSYKIFDRTFDYNIEKNILKVTFENTNEDAENKYIVYSYNFGAKLTNVEEFDTIE